MFAALDELIRALGPWGYPLFAVAALLEYVFPPFPGDSIVVLGGAWAARGERSQALLFVALMVGNLAGIAAMWRVGRAIAGPLRSAPEAGRLFGIKVSHLRRAQTAMREKGTMLLVANRFLPSFRSVLFLAAGASDVPLRRALTWGGLSAGLFNGLLVAVGAAVGNNAEAIAEFFRRFRLVSFGLLGVIGVVVLARFLLRRARAQSPT
jgi:membrane protein DedA with SNARE-associated domain